MKFKNQRMLNFTITSPLRQMKILIEISTWQNTSNRNKNYFNPGYIKSSMQQFRLKEKKKRGTQGSSTVTLKSLCTFVDLSPFFHFSQFLCGSIAAPFIATGPPFCHPYIWMGEKSLNELLPHKMYSDEIKHVSSLILLQLLNSVRVFTKHSPPPSPPYVCVCVQCITMYRIRLARL